jgi:hypothetical protein
MDICPPLFATGPSYNVVTLVQLLTNAAAAAAAGCRGKWSSASKDEVEAEMAKGTPYCYRFRVPANKVPCAQRCEGLPQQSGLGSAAASLAGMV